MLAILVAGIVGILATTPATDVAARSTILTIIPIVGTLLGGVWISGKIDNVKQDVKETKAIAADVREQTNGHMTTLIAAKTTPEVTTNDGSAQ